MLKNETRKEQSVSIQLLLEIMTFLLTLLSMLACLTSACGLDKFNYPDTVETLDAPSYLGRWYQTYASAIPLFTYEKKGYCITADYYNPTPVGEKGLSFSLVNSLK